MIFVLHFIAAIQIVFTLLTNYAQRHPIILCEAGSEHGNAFSAAFPATWTSQRKAPLALTQKEDSDPSQVETATVGEQAPRSPLQGYSLHQSNPQRDHDRCRRSLAMPNMQEDLQCNASILRRVWDFMASLCRPILPATAETDQIATLSSMELCKSMDRPRLGGSSMGSTNNPINLNGQRPQEGVPRREDGHQRKRPKKLQRRPKGQKAKARMQAWTKTELARPHCLPTRWIHHGCNR